MATRFTTRAASALFAGTVIATTLVGCGAAPTAIVGASVSAADAEALEATVLKKAFERIHQGVFHKLDADGNKAIDEYEAGPQLSLADFSKADKSKNHKLTYAEFKKYAVTNLFLFKDTPSSFLSRFRADLGKVFNRLDENRDGLLAKTEVSQADLRKLRLTFEYPRLNIKVPIQNVGDAFAASDKTGDGKLGQAEWEDCYIELVVVALGGDGGATPPAPPEPQPEPAPVDPAPAPVDPAPQPAPAKSKK
jgi:hypothetical protein